MGLGGDDREQTEREPPASFDEADTWIYYEDLRDKASFDNGINDIKEFLALSDVTKYSKEDLQKMGWLDYNILWFSKKQMVDERAEAAKKDK